MIKDLIKAMRPNQWIKNMFVFLPLVFGKKIFSYPENFKTGLAFIAFTCASASVYLLNDILDIQADRAHPGKSLRPIASGRVSVPFAFIAAMLLALGAIALSLVVDFYLGCVVIIYLLLNILYSRILKHRVLVDVGCIGCFFLLRIAAGSVASNVELSHWIIFLTALLALFLGFNKRRQELQLSDEASAHRRVLLQYDHYFIDQMISVVTSSIVVVYMLYTVDPATISRFGTEHLIYSIPFVYYGIFRYLYLVHKIQVDGDPTKALLFDLRMQVNLFCWIAVCVTVIYFGL